MIIFVDTWEQANRLTPVVGAIVNIAEGGCFSWFRMWNPIAGEYQIVRG